VDDEALDGLRQLVALSATGDLDELLEAFARETRSRIAQLRRAIAAGDGPGVASIAHTVIGSSASFGAVRVGQVARKLQGLASDGDLAGAAAVLEQLEADFALTAAVMGVP
jgi:HPt (histidine-containing phosphotransfer) domain-containing protein